MLRASFASDGARRDPVRVAVAPRRFLGDSAAGGAWRQQQLFFEHTLMSALAQAHGLPVGMHLPDAEDAQSIAETYAEICDGLLLQGGTDIDRALSQAGAAAPPDLARDRFELALLSSFLRRDKAVLGICRGMQLINVAHGGTLETLDGASAAWHSDPPRYAAHAHAVDLAHGGYLAALYGTPSGTVSSAHRQAASTLGDDLVVEARSTEDGRIEALRGVRRRYLVGVQWHPELDGADHGRLPGAHLFADFIAHASHDRSDASPRTQAQTCPPAYRL